MAEDLFPDFDYTETPDNPREEVGTKTQDSTRLYEIREEIEQVLSQNPTSDEEQELAEAMLDGLFSKFEDKVENCIACLKNLKSARQAHEVEIRKLTNRKQTIVKHETFLKEYIKREMEKLGLRRIQAGVHKASVVKSRLSVDVQNVDALPEEFKRISVEPNKRLLVDYMSDTGDIPDGVVPVHNTHLRYS